MDCYCSSQTENISGICDQCFASHPSMECLRTYPDSELKSAAEWISGYFDATDEIKTTLVSESMMDSEWHGLVAFVCECFRKDIKPTFVLEFAISAQEQYNDLLNYTFPIDGEI